MRADRCLKTCFPTLTQRQVREAFEHMMVRNRQGSPLKKGNPVTSSDEIDFKRLEDHLQRLRLGNASIEIAVLKENTDVWTIDKPTGVACHPLSLFDDNTVTHWAFAHFPQTRKLFPDIQPALTPHRLDTGTSGVVLVAKNQKAYQDWRNRFEKKVVHKKYLAWCWGKPKEAIYFINDPIAHALSDKRKMTTNLQRARAPIQKAESRITPLKQLEDHFLCNVTCSTGATHQVRVHLAKLGFPVMGDSLYDKRFAKRPLSLSSHQLRAVELNSESFSCKADERAFSQDPTIKRQ